jgi:hypothetical protein
MGVKITEKVERNLEKMNVQEKWKNCEKMSKKQEKWARPTPKMCILLIKEALKVNVDSPQQSFERLPPGLGPKWVKMGRNRVKNGVERVGKMGTKNRKIEIRKCKNWGKKQKKMG